MQGFNLLIQMGSALLNGFGLMSMIQAFVGAILFLATLAYLIQLLQNRK